MSQLLGIQLLNRFFIITRQTPERREREEGRKGERGEGGINIMKPAEEVIAGNTNVHVYINVRIHVQYTPHIVEGTVCTCMSLPVFHCNEVAFHQ